MYILAAYSIDPRSSKQAMQFITCDSYEPGMPPVNTAAAASSTASPQHILFFQHGRATTATNDYRQHLFNTALYIYAPAIKPHSGSEPSDYTSVPSNQHYQPQLWSNNPTNSHLLVERSSPEAFKVFHAEAFPSKSTPSATAMGIQPSSNPTTLIIRFSHHPESYHQLNGQFFQRAVRPTLPPTQRQSF